MIATLVLISGCFTVEPQETRWKNPADKYENSYQVYLDAECPIGPDDIKHFVYFARDRARIRNHVFLEDSRYEGAQFMYSWRQLETSKGEVRLLENSLRPRLSKSAEQAAFHSTGGRHFYGREQACTKLSVGLRF
ncbi:MAG: hypothetical protein AAFZ74_10870 [Pseudomonadota bacterium]